MPTRESARETLLAELREHALVIGEVMLSSGRTAQYYVDARQALQGPVLGDGAARYAQLAIGGNRVN